MQLAPDPHRELLADHPELAQRWGSLIDQVWANGAVDPVVLELCRLRVAGLLGVEWAARYCTPSVGLDAELAAAVSSWPTDPRFDELARACLSVAEQFVLDVRGVSDEEMRALRERLGDAGLVQLTMALAMWDGIYRVARTLPAQSPSSD